MTAQTVLSLPAELQVLIEVTDLQLKCILENDHQIISQEMVKVFKRHQRVIDTITGRTKSQLNKMYTLNSVSDAGLFTLLAQTSNYAYFFKLLYMSKEAIENHSFKTSCKVSKQEAGKAEYRAEQSGVRYRVEPCAEHS